MSDVENTRVLGGRKMQQHTASRWMVVVLVVVPLLLTACGAGSGEESAVKPPAVAEKIDGGSAIRVVVSAEAAKRLDIRTVSVRRDGSATRTVIPYAAVLYDPDGDTWTYTSPKHLVFVRHDISVDRIDGDSAFLTAGPEAGTQVVTVGATELWGVEYGGIEED
jgi:hypothetical protein